MLNLSKIENKKPMKKTNKNSKKTRKIRIIT